MLADRPIDVILDVDSRLFDKLISVLNGITLDLVLVIGSNDFVFDGSKLDSVFTD